MTRGIYRTNLPDLGECVRIDWFDEPKAYMTRDLYKVRGFYPRFDDLPTRPDYASQNA